MFTKYITAIQAGFKAATVDFNSAIELAQQDVIDGTVSNASVADESVVYRVTYCVAALIIKALRWTYKNDINLNITAAVLSLPLLPVAFGYINVATVIAMIMSFVALTELFVPMSANLGMSATVVRAIGYSAAVVKAAIVLGVGAFFM